MDFLHESKKILHIAQSAVQKKTQKAGEAIDTAKEATTEFLTSSAEAIGQ